MEKPAIDTTVTPPFHKKLYKEHYRYNCNLYFKVNKKKLNTFA